MDNENVSFFLSLSRNEGDSEFMCHSCAAQCTTQLWKQNKTWWHIDTAKVFYTFHESRGKLSSHTFLHKFISVCGDLITFFVWKWLLLTSNGSVGFVQSQPVDSGLTLRVVDWRYLYLWHSNVQWHWMNILWLCGTLSRCCVLC